MYVYASCNRRDLICTARSAYVIHAIHSILSVHAAQWLLYVRPV